MRLAQSGSEGVEVDMKHQYVDCLRMAFPGIVSVYKYKRSWVNVRHNTGGRIKARLTHAKPGVSAVDRSG